MKKLMTLATLSIAISFSALAGNNPTRFELTESVKTLARVENQLLPESEQRANVKATINILKDTLQSSPATDTNYPLCPEMKTTVRTLTKVTDNLPESEKRSTIETTIDLLKSTLNADCNEK